MPVECSFQKKGTDGLVDITLRWGYDFICNTNPYFRILLAKKNCYFGQICNVVHDSEALTQIREKNPLASCPLVCPHVPARFPLDGFVLFDIGDVY